LSRILSSRPTINYNTTKTLSCIPFTSSVYHKWFLLFLPSLALIPIEVVSLIVIYSTPWHTVQRSTKKFSTHKITFSRLQLVAVATTSRQPPSTTFSCSVDHSRGTGQSYIPIQQLYLQQGIPPRFISSVTGKVSQMCFATASDRSLYLASTDTHFVNKIIGKVQFRGNYPLPRSAKSFKPLSSAFKATILFYPLHHLRPSWRRS
jgi:hypothetical protein